MKIWKYVLTWIYCLIVSRARGKKSQWLTSIKKTLSGRIKERGQITLTGRGKVRQIIYWICFLSQTIRGMVIWTLFFKIWTNGSSLACNAQLKLYKMRTSRQILITRQNGVCWGLKWNFRNFCHPVHNYNFSACLCHLCCGCICHIHCCFVDGKKKVLSTLNALIPIILISLK